MNKRKQIGESRRSFMAKSAFATGALALGTATLGTSTVNAQQERIAVFSDNFYPGAPFDVITQIEASTTVDTLQFRGETVPGISQPDEWRGYLIRYRIGSESGGITMFLFVRGRSLSEGDSGMISGDASVLSADLNLLSTTLEGDGVDEEPADNESGGE